MIKLLIFIIILFILLSQFRNIEKEHEQFKNIFIENFESNIPSIISLVPETSYEVKNETNNVNKKSIEEKCEKNTKDCLFGCPKEEKDVIVNEEDIDVNKKPVRKTNVDEMIMSIEDTEKICDLIEEKDKKRREREEEENLKRQIELNKRFLIQQKAQNKQIEDLEKIIKGMTFTQQMNEVGIEKCGVSADQCLTNKEKDLINLMKLKKKNQKNVKVNLNLENFDKSFLDELKNKFNFSNSELSKLLEAIKSGKLDINNLKTQLNNSNNSNEYNNPYRNSNSNSNINNSSEFKKGTISGCPNCKIDLSEYIDRCKIPCNKCRDPSWNCPQDKK